MQQRVSRVCIQEDLSVIYDCDCFAATYEISPYATFSVPGNNSRSVTTSTLDYTVQFKTFGHIEDGERNASLYPKKHSWHKHRYYSNDGNDYSMMFAVTSVYCLGNQRLRPSRLQPSRGDSESDETSGSPYGEFPGGGASYRVPVKPTRGERTATGYSGYETLLVADLFRPDSSTESNDVSPVVERRDTPRHLVATVMAGQRRHDRATTTSSR